MFLKIQNFYEKEIFFSQKFFIFNIIKFFYILNIIFLTLYIDFFIKDTSSIMRFA